MATIGSKSVPDDLMDVDLSNSSDIDDFIDCIVSLLISSLLNEKEIDGSSDLLLSICWLEKFFEVDLFNAKLKVFLDSPKYLDGVAFFEILL